MVVTVWLDSALSRDGGAHACVDSKECHIQT